VTVENAEMIVKIDLEWKKSRFIERKCWVKVCYISSKSLEISQG